MIKKNVSTPTNLSKSAILKFISVQVECTKSPETSFAYVRSFWPFGFGMGLLRALKNYLRNSIYFVEFTISVIGHSLFQYLQEFYILLQSF